MDMKRYIKLSLALEDIVMDQGFDVSYVRFMHELYVKNSRNGTSMSINISEDVDGSYVLDRQEFLKLVTTLNEVN